MLKISYRAVLAFFLLEFALIFVGALALVDGVKKEAVDRPTEIVLIREEPSESQIEPIPEETVEPIKHYISDCILTAYCSCYECCGIWSPEYTGQESHTYSGTVPEQGRTIAVDPNIIPIGSTVVINGHEYIAEDTGAFSGNLVDVYHSSHEEALIFGRQTADIYWY